MIQIGAGIMAYVGRLLLLAGLSVFALTAEAKVDYAARCQADYDRQVELLEPLSSALVIMEPERIAPRDAILNDARSIRDDALVCKAKTDVDELAACLDVIGARTQANRNAALDARLLERSDTVVASETPLDKRRIEGMSGPRSPFARKAREALRNAHARNAALWQAAESARKECLSYAPIPSVNGVCSPPNKFSSWSGEITDVNGDAIPPDLCFGPPKPPPLPPSSMQTNRAPFGPARSIRVAFDGGTPAMRNAIRKIAQEWADSTNRLLYPPNGSPINDPYRLEKPLAFDFGKNTAQSFEFNTWSSDDTEFAAEIRIGFDDGHGWWSDVGTESTDPDISSPGIASMNLEGMHGYKRPPKDWRRLVFHEFGHALGLQHEHQHPISACGAALRLEDDEAYKLTLDEDNAAIADKAGRRPGVMTSLEYAPNYWPREFAAFNLGQLKKSGDLDTTPFDPDSIMRYEFAAEWYRDDAPTECLPTGKLGTKPSNMDFAMVAKTYRKMMRRRLD
jgi:hypothetical protein